MSAQARLLDTSMRSVGAAEAFYFNSGDQRLFGMLHRSTSAVTADMGVVICQPFGYESICAHRGMRAFAEAIAAAGMPALRFDYAGTGDSSDVDPHVDQLQIWTQDVLAAARNLKRQTGVKKVCLLGFRLGALLATLAASKDGGVNALIAVSPIVVGRRYLRELRTMRLAASMTLGQSDSPLDKQQSDAGAMEISGFTFSAATLESLAKVDQSSLYSQSPLHMLIIDSATTPVAEGKEHSAEMNGQRTHLALPGLVEMLMTAPQFAIVPTGAIAATLDWLLNLPVSLSPDHSSSGQPMSDPTFLGQTKELTLAESGTALGLECTERPVFFGNDALLFGIITKPPANETRQRAVILLNAGADHHIGASRLYVSMARSWAKHGYVVLRMDFAGVGDSGTRPGRVQDDVFPPDALDDLRAAIEFVRSNYGIYDVTLAGLCSGAYHALRAAVAGLAINRILMINPQNYFWRSGETLQGLQLAEVVHNPGLYRERVFSLAAWKRMVTGEVNILRIAKIYLQRPLLAAESTLRDIARRLHVRLPNDLGTELEEIVARGIRVVFVFARDEPGIGLLKLQAGNSVKRLGERCRIYTVNGGDHVFTRSGPRAIMEKIVSDELFARPEWLDKPNAKLTTGGLKFDQ